MHGATVLAVGYIDTLTINSNLSVVLGASGGHQHESQRDLFSVVYKPSIHIYIILYYIILYILNDMRQLESRFTYLHTAGE